MKNVPENELFSAYLDGELTAGEQAQIERLLATSPAARQLMDELRALSSTLQALPQHKLGEDLSERVLRLAERRMLSEPVSPQSRHDLPSPHRIRWRPILRRVFKPRNLLWPAVAAAVAIFLMMTDSGRFPPADDREVASVPETAGEATGTSGPAVLEKTAEELAESEESEKSPPETFYKDGPLDALPERGGLAGEVAASAQPVTPEPEDLAGLTDAPATAPGLPRVPKAPMPELPSVEEPPGMGKTPGPSARTSGFGGAGAALGRAVQPVTEPDSRAGGVQARDSDPAKPDLPPSGPDGTAPGPRPAPVAPPAMPPGDVQPIRNVLVVRCNISAEAARGRVFDRVLSLQRVTRAKADARKSQDDRYFHSHRILEDQDVAEGAGAKAEQNAEQIRFDVEATPAQLRAIVTDLMSRPDEFSFVSDLSPLGIPATRPRSLNGRQGLAVDELFGVHRFGSAKTARGHTDAEGEGQAARRELKHGGLGPAGPDAGYGMKGLGTHDAADPSASPESSAEATPREAEGGTLPDGEPAAKPAAEPEASQVLPQLDQPAVPSEEPVPADAAEPMEEEEGVAEQSLRAPDAPGVPVVERPPRPSPAMPPRRDGQKPEADEPDEEQAVSSQSGTPGKAQDKKKEEPDRGELPDDGAERVLVRFVFQVVRPDVPIAADVMGKPAASPAAAMEVEAAAEAMEPPAAEATPAQE